MVFDEERLTRARDYLSDYLADEDWFGEEAAEWFDTLGDYVSALPLDDPRLMEAVRYLQPFLDDDDRIDSAMYPGGAAVSYIEYTDWGGGHDRYLTGFIAATSRDWQQWQQQLSELNDAAEWRA